jgi:hypothetical protein
MIEIHTSLDPSIQLSIKLVVKDQWPEDKKNSPSCIGVTYGSLP